MTSNCDRPMAGPTRIEMARQVFAIDELSKALVRKSGQGRFSPLSVCFGGNLPRPPTRIGVRALKIADLAFQFHFQQPKYVL